MKSKGSWLLPLSILVLGMLVIPFLTSCSPIQSEDVINSLLPNVWVFLSHITATVILLVIMTSLVWKPSRAALEKRRDYIANQIKEAETLRKNAAKELEAANNKKLEAFSQANEIMNNATNEGYSLKEKLEAEAKMNAKQIRTDAENEAKKIKREIASEMEASIVDNACLLASNLIKQKITKEDNDALINEFIEQMEKVKE